jgi:hypothetical protein
MRRLLLLTLAIIFVHGVALGQQTEVGSLDIFADEGAASCNIFDTPGLVNVYVFASPGADGSRAAQFKVEASPEMMMTYITVTSDFQFIDIGGAMSNLSVAYATCLTTQTKIATLLFNGAGNSGTCGLFTIKPADGLASGMIEIVTCDNFKVLFEQLGQARLNPDDTCLCQVPVQEKTWGGIKALYN